jgi:hypothetical protein
MAMILFLSVLLHFFFNLLFIYFRETGSIEQHAEALVTLLESCLSHNLKPSLKDEDPPHAKISSDIISCLFLVNIQQDLQKSQ